jgi:hypothetical protein
MVHRIVLDVELADTEAGSEPVGSDERREAGMETRPRLALDRQELTVPPEALGSRLDRLPEQNLSNGLVVPRYLERAKALVADPERGGSKRRVTQVAAESEVHDVC